MGVGYMTKIYTSLDIGNYEIKLLVFKIVNNKQYLLGKFVKRTKGVKKNKIEDFHALTIILKQLFNEAEKELNCLLNKVIVSIPNYNTKYKVVSKLDNRNIEEISGADITSIMRLAVENELDETDELISFMPIEFKVDNILGIKNPLGMSGNSFGVKGMMISQPKRQVHDIIGVLSGINVEVVDVVLSSVGDYYEFRNTLTDNTMGAVVDIGLEKTEITLFNMGIPFMSDSINMGSINVDMDLSYINNISVVGARRLKEDFVLATTDKASVKEVITVRNNEKQEITLNQLTLSEVTEARLKDILNLTNQKINALTNLQVSYIIITGGISQLVGFRKLCVSGFGSKLILGDIKTIGIRHNKFSTSSGIVKYFNEKMLLRQKEYSMLDNETLDNMVVVKEKKNFIHTGVISKIFGKNDEQ